MSFGEVCVTVEVALRRRRLACPLCSFSTVARYDTRAVVRRSTRAPIARSSARRRNPTLTLVTFPGRCGSSVTPPGGCRTSRQSPPAHGSTAGQVTLTPAGCGSSATPAGSWQKWRAGRCRQRRAARRVRLVDVKPRHMSRRCSTGGSPSTQAYRWCSSSPTARPRVCSRRPPDIAGLRRHLDDRRPQAALGGSSPGTQRSPQETSRRRRRTITLTVDLTGPIVPRGGRSGSWLVNGSGVGHPAEG